MDIWLSRAAPRILRAAGAALWLGLAVQGVPVRAQDELDDLDDTSSSRKRDRDDHAGNADSDAAASDDDAASADASPPAAAEVAGDVDSGPSVVIEPFAGVGMTMRSFKRPLPMMAGVQTLRASALPAVEAGLRVTAWPKASFALSVNLIYQSAVGYSVAESPPFALQNHVRARSERVALELVPSWAMGAARLAIGVGATVRTLWPEVHTLQTPGYSLVGPHGRIELSLRLGSAVSVRLSPEVHWISRIDDLLLATGVNPQGFAWGGELGIHAVLSSAWGIGLNYRESHAFASTTRSMTFTDVERYLTLRVVGTF